MMRHPLQSLAVIVLLSASCAGSPVDNFSPEDVISLERGALERWGKGDPEGYLSIMDPNVTYFDPTTQARIDGREQLKPLIEFVRGKLQIDRSEMLNPTVVRSGDVAILTFNLISHGASFNGSPKRDARWNTTEVYRRVAGEWKIIQSHFSYTTPQLAQPATP